MDAAVAYRELEALVVDNSELEHLERMLGEFNIFEAIGMVRQEIRHSHFLSYLLDPNQNHGLGDLFLQRFLQKGVSQPFDHALPVNPIELGLFDLSGMIVQREWQNIDIFMQHDDHQIVVIIENKIGTSEHSNQLQRYWRTASQKFPGYRLLGFYLTPDGHSPSDERYIAVDYGLVSEILEDLSLARESTLGPDILTLIQHYTAMLRRHLVEDSEIIRLCRQIYTKHKKALDLIHEHKPDVQDAIYQLLSELIDSQDDMEILYESKRSLRFMPSSWNVPQLIDQDHLLSLYFDNEPSRLKVRLVIDPGDVDKRQKLLDAAIDNRKEGFFVRTHSLNQNWNSIFTDTWLQEGDYDDFAMEELETKIRHKFQQFVDEDMPKLSTVIEEEISSW